MDINKEKEIIIDHWDNAFKNSEFKLLEADQVDLSSTLNKAIIDMANQSERILDIGTGSGYGLLTAKFHGEKFKEGIGIDPSPYAINALQVACRNAAINNVQFIQGDHESLDTFEDASFDGIICSNVLDVLPKPISQNIIASIKRLLRKNGLLVLKLNFHLTDELIERLNMELVENNTYKMKGVIRGLNYTSEVWVDFFKPLKLIKTDTYQRIQNGPPDRLFIFKKTE